jgi:hypothetical protein
MSRTSQLAAVLSSKGEAIELAYRVNAEQPQNLVLHLYVNDFSPGLDTSLEDFEEASGYGYQPLVIDGAQWTFEGARPTHAKAVQSFQLTGPLGRVYGWYLTREFGGEYMYGERFPLGAQEVTYPTVLKVTMDLTQSGEQ